MHKGPVGALVLCPGLEPGSIPFALYVPSPHTQLVPKQSQLATTPLDIAISTSAITLRGADSMIPGYPMI